MATAYLDFERVKREVTIPEVLREFGLLDRFKESNGRWRGVCPLPTHIHNPVRPNPQQFVADCRQGVWLFRCFSPECSAGGDVTELVKRLASLDNYSHVRLWFLEKFPQLADTKPRDNSKRIGESGDTKKASEDVGQDRPSPAVNVAQPIVSLPTPTLKPLRWFYDLDPKCDYLLKSRRFQPTTIQRFGIGKCSRGYLRDYIAIPIYLPDQGDGENPVSYIGRFAGERESWDEKFPRWKFWKEFPRNEIVYGLREALRDSPSNAPLVVVEGALKVAWIFQETGLTNIVATFGASLSDQQSETLLGTQRPIVLFWDGNAHVAAAAAARQLQGKAFVRTVLLPDGIEPEDLCGDDLRMYLHFLL